MMVKLITIDGEIIVDYNKDITYLDLIGRGIIEISDDICSLNLKYLYLTSNQISLKTITKLTNLTSLTSLALSHNRLKKIPHNFYMLKNLRELYLNNNLLEKMPNIYQLTNLEGLYLDHNHIKILSSDIYRLTKLDGLYLDNNKLKFIPLLPNVTALFIKNNQIIFLPCNSSIRADTNNIIYNDDV